MEGESCPWSHLAPASMHFCEQRLCAWVVEPANTWSNLAYVAVGLYLLWRQRQQGELRSALTAFGVTSVLVGLGSAFFHGTGTRLGEVLDVSAMYLISGLFVAFAAKRFWSLTDSRTITIYAGLCAASVAWMLVSYSNGIWLFTAEVTAAGLLEIALFRRMSDDMPHRRRVYLEMLWLSVCFVLAFTAWTLDVKELLCAPNNHVFGGHAFWHVSNSLCLLFYWRFHRQIRRLPT